MIPRGIATGVGRLIPDMWKYVSFTAVIAVLLVLLLNEQGNRRQEAVSSPAETVLPAPAWKFNQVDGRPLSSREFVGKVVILNFWATWCPPCQAEIPGFVELQEKYGKEGLVIVGVSLDRAGPATVKGFMQRLNMNYPVVMGDEKIVRDYGGIEALPTTFIINRDGHLTKMHVGYADRQTFEDLIRPLL